jgi:prepilin-type N-terminal cleavage/methylation domain-containing protein
MTRIRHAVRRGMSMVELIIGMVVLAVIGMSMTKIMLSQARYFSHQKQSNAARNVARGPLNRVVSDLRMVEARGGVMFASDTAVQMRVPYAMGVVCGISGGTHISLLPADSAMYAAPGYSGYAWRGGNGVYRYKEDNHVKDVGILSVCDNAAIYTLTAQGAKVVKITPALPDTASVGTPVFLYRQIRYSFRPSLAVPGTKGLFRTTVATGTTEELSAPFDNSVKFRFYTGTSVTASATPPADLSKLRGVEMQMPGMSEKVPMGSTAKYKSIFNTAIFFKNRLD